MFTDSSGITDELEVRMDRGRSHIEAIGIKGLIVAELWRPDGSLRERIVTENLVTQVGDQMYAERAVGIASPPDAPTGMQLGTGTTAVSKTGAGATTVTYISGSHQAFEGGYPTSSIPASSRRLSYRNIWAAGTATNAAIAEIALGNATVTDVTLPEANSIARGLFGSTIDKQASDTLTVDWHHDFLGA